MKRNVGLWIDHHKTVMVTIENDKEVTREIRSNVEKYMRLSGGLQGKETNISPMSLAETVGDRRYENHLNEYYDGVVSLVRNADAIWIFGPGEAKVEFKRRLEHENLGGLIDSVETVDKMTGRQVAEKVRQHYQK